jgi:NAD(P)-dependent dehydrogenase (short-subunit alcohol dehydrogenase family)
LSGRLAGKHAIVTGAGRGIGRAIARAMAAEGAQVLLLGRTEAPLTETERLIDAGGNGGAWSRGCDVRDDDQVEAAVRAAVERWGRIDVLANNAGIDDDTPFLDVDRGKWRDILATNLTAPFVMSQAVARVMRDIGGGSIIHNASIDASGGDGPYVAYNASKAGLLGLSRTIALELGPYGIRSNCVSPGFTHTEMTEAAVGPKLMEYLQGSFARVPLRRLVRPEEVAAAFVFLASDEASAITGTELRVDAGLTANWYILETIPTEPTAEPIPTEPTAEPIPTEPSAETIPTEPSAETIPGA